MPTQDTAKIKEKILQILRENGPSLPVHIANGTKLSILFASAFLSELISEQKIQISNMKVGSSPLYFLPDHREKLENFSRYIKGKEKEAFDLLLQKKILADKEQEPAIRVALRSIKDFAIPFTKNEEIFWRYFNFKEEIKEEQKINLEKKQEENFNREELRKKENTQEIPKRDFEQKEENESKNIEEKVDGEEIDLRKEILYFLEKNGVKILEETEMKKRDFLGIGRVETNLGEFEVLIIGKDKKRINEKDLQKILETGIQEKKIILFLCTGEMDKKAKEFFRECKNLVKFFKIG